MKKEEVFQGFDTKEDRFKVKNEEKPGPGEYNSDKYYEYHHKVAFYRSSMPRFTQKNRSETEITYFPEYVKETIKETNFSQKPAIFGSGTKRFIEKKKVIYFRYLLIFIDFYIY